MFFFHSFSAMMGLLFLANASRPLGHVYSGINFGGEDLVIFDTCNLLPPSMGGEISSYMFSDDDFSCTFYRSAHCGSNNGSTDEGNVLWTINSAVGKKQFQNEIGGNGLRNVTSILCQGYVTHKVRLTASNILRRVLATVYTDFNFKGSQQFLHTGCQNLGPELLSYDLLQRSMCSFYPEPNCTDQPLWTHVGPYSSNLMGSSNDMVQSVYCFLTDSSQNLA